MWDYLERIRKRYVDLAQGADADLVKDNKRRWKWSAIIAGCGLLLLGVLAYVKLPQPWSKLISIIAGILTIGGLMLGRYALLWDGIIYRPDPKGPPSLFK
jgi:hypothetical protein